MTSFADRTIDALRSTHDELAAMVRELSDEQLDSISGAPEWTVAQVLSHLGSGAEISHATLRAALAEEPGPESNFNQEVWDRWDALPPREQAEEFLAGDEALLTAMDALSTDERARLNVKLGFLPSPVPVAAYAGMRLNEVAQHSWDVRVTFDPDAVIFADTAAVLAEQFGADLGFLLGFAGKADALPHPAVVAIQGSTFSLAIADTVSVLTKAAEPTATFDGPLEAAIRLLAGRLTTQHTADGIEATGNVTLDDLRRVFPGY